jgi:hypothetical protein
VAFRDQNPAALAVADPLERFFALEAALEAGRGLLGDRSSIRLAAALLVRLDGEPEELAAGVRATHERLTKAAGWMPSVATPLWLLVAGVLVERGDDPEAFAAQIDSTRKRMRAVRMRRYTAFEVIVVLALRLHTRPGPITDDSVARVQAIYAAMKRHHWWLTGPEDLPACAILAMTERSPAELAGQANAIYEGLRPCSWPGESLQTASNMLAVSPLEPGELVDRFVTLSTSFEQAGLSIGFADYGTVASLCFLAQPAARIAETVAAHTWLLHGRLAWIDVRFAFNLAAQLAYTRLLGEDPQLGLLADAKALFDMQKLIEQQSGMGG